MHESAEKLGSIGSEKALAEVNPHLRHIKSSIWICLAVPLLLTNASAEEKLEFKSFRLGMTLAEVQRIAPMKCKRPEPTLNFASCGDDKEMARQLRDLSAVQHADKICDVSKQTIVGYPLHLTRLSFYGETLGRIDLDLRFPSQKGNKERVREVIDTLSTKYGKPGHVEVFGLKTYLADTWRTTEGEIKLEDRGQVLNGPSLYYSVPIYIESKSHEKTNNERTAALNTLSGSCGKKSYEKNKAAAGVRAKDL